jgi:hypothetical protein
MASRIYPSWFFLPPGESLRKNSPVYEIFIGEFYSPAKLRILIYQNSSAPLVSCKQAMPAGWFMDFPRDAGFKSRLRLGTNHRLKAHKLLSADYGIFICPPHLVAILPFVLLLGVIALAPFFFADWWGKHYPKVCGALASIVVAYYLLWLTRRAKCLAHDAGIYQLHRARWLVVCCLRRHSYRRGRRSNAAGERAFFAGGRGARKAARHHRRVYASNPAVDPDEQIPDHGSSHHIFHLHCF